MQYIVGITIAIFLVFLLIVKRKNKADWVLMYWLITLSMHIGFYYLDTSAMIEKYSFLAGFSIPFPLLHGPFLYVYTSLLLNPNGKINNHWLHFLPFILLNLTLIPFYSLPPSKRLFIFQNNGLGYETFVFINAILIFSSGVIYFSTSFFAIQKYRKNIKCNFSHNEGKTLDWLQFLTLGIGIIWFFVFIGNNDFIFSGLVLFIILIGIFGVRQNNIFSNEPYIIDRAPFPAKDEKYEKSGLNKDDKTEIIKRLEQLIENEKPYLNPKLSLNELAGEIDTQPNYLSQILNEHFEMNFYDFVNSKRVDEFCRKLRNNELMHYKLIEIAYECGFNSKSAFNRNFKRFIGKTPSEYKKAL
jgi:AraC-like DNA-binding protein